MKKVVYLLFLISFTSLCQRIRPIYATVLDSIGPIDNVNIVNKNSKKGTNTNKNGVFKIFCQLGDTLSITSIQHQKKRIIIKQSDFNSLKFDIYLKTKTYELDEIELKKHNLLGILTIDAANIKENKNDINAITLGLPNAGRKKMKQIDRKIYTAKGGSYLLSVDLIINSISGRLKKLKFRKKLAEEDEDVLKILIEFKFNLATNFNIHKDNEYQFLYFCVKDPHFIKEHSKNKFEFIQFLQKKAIEFNKLKKE